MYLSGILDFYAALSMKTYAQQHPGDARAHEKFAMDVSAYLDTISTHMALCFRDYLWLIALGEARHAGGNCKYLCPSIPWVSSRGAAYTVLTHFPPIPENISIVKEVFMLPEWGSAIGGRRWAKIADAVNNYKQYPASVYVDNVSSIVHNGGLAFNKNEAENHLDLKLDISTNTMQRILEAAKQQTCFAAEFPSSEYDVGNYAALHDFIRPGTLSLLWRFSKLYEQRAWLSNLDTSRADAELLYTPCQWRTKRLLPLVRNTKNGIRDHIADFEDHNCIFCNYEQSNCKLADGAYACEACMNARAYISCECGIYVIDSDKRCEICQHILHDNCNNAGKRVCCRGCNRIVCINCMTKCNYCSKSICATCANQTYTTCEQCGGTFCASCCSSRLLTTSCKKAICHNCIFDHIEACELCVKHFCWRCNEFHADELAICEYCEKHVCTIHLATCSHCNHLYCEHCVGMRKCGDCGCTICDFCFGDHMYACEGSHEQFCLVCITRRGATSMYKLCTMCSRCYTGQHCDICDTAVCSNCAVNCTTCQGCGRFMCDSCTESHDASRDFHTCIQCGRVLCALCKPHFSSKCGLLFCSPACIKAHYAGGCERELSKNVPLCNGCNKRHLVGSCKVCGAPSTLCEKCSKAQGKYSNSSGNSCCICSTGMCKSCEKHPNIWRMKGKGNGRLYIFCGEACILRYYKQYNERVKSGYTKVHRVENDNVIWHQPEIAEIQEAPLIVEQSEIAVVEASAPMKSVAPSKSSNAFVDYIKIVEKYKEQT